MSDNYKPQYSEEEIESLNYSNRAKYNLTAEESTQRVAAMPDENDEKPIWRIANKLMGWSVFPGEDSRKTLETLGFEILEREGVFYLCHPPQDWTKQTEGYWTEIYDADGKQRLTQFYKGAIYDERAFVKPIGE